MRLRRNPRHRPPAQHPPRRQRSGQSQSRHASFGRTQTGVEKGSTARETEGAFDPTIRPLAELWGFIKRRATGYQRD